VKRLITAETAGHFSLLILAMLAIFHLLVMSKIIPSDIVWGGHAAESGTSLVVMESIALVLTLIFGFVILMKMGCILKNKAQKTVNMSIWIIFVYFILNIIGNLLTGLTAECLIFGPLSAIMALLILRLAL